jgi:uncharacterized protein (TIGR03435 family)
MAELSILAKATIILAAGLIASRCAHRASAAVRAAILASTFAALLVLPLAGVLFVQRPVVIPVTYSTEAASFFVEDLGMAEPAGRTPSSPRQAATRLTLPDIETMLRAVWIAGAVGFMVPVVVALVRLRRVRRRGGRWTDGHALVEQLASETDVRRPISVFLSGGLSAPMTCGWWRPAIGLPHDAAVWPHPDVRRALLHELEHVRRRDWPVHLLARLVCAMYWFHPLGWIAWRQLSLECERACDDAVLREEERTAYAEQLVSLARRLSPDSLSPMLSMASRSHLSTRVGAVLASDLARGRASALVVTIVGVAAASVMLALSPLQAVQTAAAASAAVSTQTGAANHALSFGVASVRPNDGSDRSRGFGFTLATGRLHLRNQTVRTLISIAYSQPFSLFFPDERISGGPEWMNEERYTIEARAERAVTGAEMGAMLRSLLADRFKLKVRVETRELPVYVLVTARQDRQLGPELRRSDIDCASAPQCGIGGGAGRNRLAGSTMALFAASLTELVGRPVVDRTGLEGSFDGTLTWSPTPDQTGPFREPAPGTPAPDAGPSLFTALEEQFGLKLQSQRGPVEFLLVESVERPTPNDAPGGTPAAPPQAAAPQPTFEVASIRRNVSGQQIIRGPSVQASGRVLGENLPVRLMIATAFGIEFNRVVGGPEWVNTDGYDLDARAGVGATQDQIRAMLRALLVARFGLVARRESEERDIYTLVRVRTDRTGPQLRVSGPDCAPIRLPAGLPAPPASPPPPAPTGEVPLFATASSVGCPRMFFGGFMAARRISMFDFANSLTGFARRPVVDRTGLTEAYDLDVTFTPDFVPRGPAPPTGGAGIVGGPVSGPPTAAPASPTDAPTLFTALQEQLGLRLEPGRGAVEVVVIDRVERPTEN